MPVKACETVIKEVHFQVGQVVRLVSGGPKMAIAQIMDDGNAECMWQSYGALSASKPEHHVFPLACLVHVTEEA